MLYMYSPKRASRRLPFPTNSFWGKRPLYAYVRARGRWKPQWFQTRTSPRPANRLRGHCTASVTMSAASTYAPRRVKTVSAPNVRSRGNMARSRTRRRHPNARWTPLNLVLQVGSDKNSENERTLKTIDKFIIRTLWQFQNINFLLIFSYKSELVSKDAHRGLKGSLNPDWNDIFHNKFFTEI